MSKFITEIFSKNRLLNIIEMIDILNDATYVSIVDDDDNSRDLVESEQVKDRARIDNDHFFFFNKLFIAYLLSSDYNCCLCSQTYTDK